MDNTSISQLIKSRRKLPKLALTDINRNEAAEGGCGVVGFAATEQVNGKHLLAALKQMQNRGNGKGGGIAAAGLNADFFGIDKKLLKTHNILTVAYLDLEVRTKVEEKFIQSVYEVAHIKEIEQLADYRSVKLEVQPPKVVCYFIQPKEEVIAQFTEDNNFQQMEAKTIADEFIYQQTYRLNSEFYASLGEKQAFVLSHAKNMIVLKLVGYADQVIEFYKLEEFKAYVWIGHHRYPTKGAVWHPGGAHPFIGMNEALVHNGDFANYHAVTDYLAQKNIHSLFLTDTEVSAYLFDLYSRVYEYKTEHVIEALAPTTERDFQMLPQDKQKVYQVIQDNHLHGSPDGPWFFIVSQSKMEIDQISLLGITDTSMLRPQVFAIQQGEQTLGLIASEKQGIDAILRSLNQESKQYASSADIYWNARGGSYDDGGAFIFQLSNITENPEFTCLNKFEEEVPIPKKSGDEEFVADLKQYFPEIAGESTEEVISHIIEDNITIIEKIELLTGFLDRLPLIKGSANGWYRMLIEDSLYTLLRTSTDNSMVLIDNSTIDSLSKPNDNQVLALDCSNFAPEGEKSAAMAIIKAYELGWKRVYSFDWRGQRFCGAGLGPNSDGFRIDVYGNPGDYLASGIDGAEIYVHANAQDQVAQIMKRGLLVIYGDVGQTFMYGAKGGEVYVLGNAAGRPLINAGGTPKVVINGTALDFLAESFMAGDPLRGGGFVILNGLRIINGEVNTLEAVYPGANLFSLASGGAIYVRDPYRTVGDDQLHGATIEPMTEEDVHLIEPYLTRNEQLFGINVHNSTEDSLSYGLNKMYRKTVPKKLSH